MSTTSLADIPATLEFQILLTPIQEAYKNCSINSDILICRKEYEEKVRNLSWDIIEKHSKIGSNIDLINYPRFRDLVWDALYKTHLFLDTP